MTQTYSLFTSGTGGDTPATLVTHTNANGESLRSQFSGTSAPTNPVEGQVFFNTSEKRRYVYVLTSETEGYWRPDDNVAVTSEVVTARGTTSTLNTRLSVALNDDGSLKESVPLTANKWIAETNAVAYVDSTSFTVGTDVTAIYIEDRALKLTQTVNEVAYVLSSVYDSGTNLTTVLLKSGTVDGGLDTVEYSTLVKENQPYVDTSDKANTDLDNLSATGETRFTGKANTDLDNLSATGEARFTEKVNISSIPNFIQGFSSRYASSTTYVVTSGMCVSASNDTVISLGSNIIKSMSAFAIGDNNGGLLGTLSQNSWYYQFVIYNPTTNTTDVCHSTSLTPTFPTGFTKYRLVSCFYYTNAITGFSTIANGDTIEYIYRQYITGINTVASVPQNVAITFPPPSASVPIYLNMFYGHNTTPEVNTITVDSGAGSPSVINVLNIAAYTYFPFVDKLSVYSGATSIRVTTGGNFTGLRIGCSSIIWRR